MIYNTRLISKFPMPRVSHQAALGRFRKIIHNSNSTGSSNKSSSILWSRERNIYCIALTKRRLHRTCWIRLHIYCNNRISITRGMQIYVHGIPSQYVILLSRWQINRLHEITCQKQFSYQWSFQLMYKKKNICWCLMRRDRFLLPYA